MEISGPATGSVWQPESAVSWISFNEISRVFTINAISDATKSAIAGTYSGRFTHGLSSSVQTWTFNMCLLQTDTAPPAAIGINLDTSPTDVTISFGAFSFSPSSGCDSALSFEATDSSGLLFAADGSGSVDIVGNNFVFHVSTNPSHYTAGSTITITLMIKINAEVVQTHTIFLEVASCNLIPI